ncbi:MAG: methyl-accepting chemotaxis protein [Geminocystis sp.]|nr:methyl-accepting chemotaxis protein [Geminocystis sp.]
MAREERGEMAEELEYQEKFNQARTAYLEGDLERASRLTDSILRQYPDDPSAFLLKGHICLRQQQYDLAKNNYRKVLELTKDRELRDLAEQGLAEIEEIFDPDSESLYPPQVEVPDFEEDIEEIGEDEQPDDSWTKSIQFDSIDWDIKDLEEEDIEDPTLQQNLPIPIHTDNEPNLTEAATTPPPTEDQQPGEEDTAPQSAPSIIPEDEQDNDLLDFDFSAQDIDYTDLQETSEDFEADKTRDNSEPTFVVSAAHGEEEEETGLSELEKMLTAGEHLFQDDMGDYSSQLEPLSSPKLAAKDDDRETPIKLSESEEGGIPIANEGEELFFGADLDDIPDISPEELPVSSIFTKEHKSQAEEKTGKGTSPEDSFFASEFDNEITGSFTFDTDRIKLETEGEMSFSSPTLGGVSSIPSSTFLTPEVEIPQGFLSKYYDLPLFRKQLLHGAVAAFATFVVVLAMSIITAPRPEENKTQVNQKPPTPQKVQPNKSQKPNLPQQGSQKTNAPRPNSLPSKILFSLIAAVASGSATVAMGYLLAQHLRRYTIELQNNFESIYQGNYDVRAKIYSRDEFGTLAAAFNQMTKMIQATTAEARKRAEEMEKAREDLQRQVIRLLDDVEGASRGDLTVQAEVTADVLGAVADAFNVTISNLRKIVKQVKQAAIQVHKASADSELFARNQSSDALRMAEELAVTLNSVQMMTDSIERVAENAREAEEVARSSSVTALKGGDAVERTVAGILQIRETVSETTRKVKRLAEASQQISTIVAVISQIASRTNLLALNASIQAARAGEAGRGFAIVADEVRQLADRSAKSLQEIEQIVLQIQTETGAVMTAMEESLQQVKDVTERAEQAKRALEDIIQVSNRIDALVRSITADTDEQRENSRGVAKVMQAVELTAQATSQESQRVAVSLQNLVGIARDLIASVERFKVD